MGLFSVNYRNVPGQCIYATSGLKFRHDEEALGRSFAQILPYVSLNELVGEAVCWILLPSTVAIWTFAFLLYSRGMLVAMAIAGVLYVLVYIAHLAVYSKPINYLLLVFGNRILQLAAYILLAIILIVSGSIVQAITLGAWFLFFAPGFDQLIFFFPLRPILRMFSSIAPSDQVLKNISRRYARKYL